MSKINLSREYTYMGKSYGPGLVDIPEKMDVGGGFDPLTPHADISAREKAHLAELAAKAPATAAPPASVTYTRGATLPAGKAAPVQQ